jgi:hypothetical protein
MKRSNVIKFLIGTMLGLVLAALVAFNVLLVWVATGPRSLEKLTPYLEKSLGGESNVHVRIGRSWLIWDGWKHPLDIRLEEVALLTNEGETFSTFPEISLGLDILSLVVGQILPTSLSVTKPVISIKQNPDKSLGLNPKVEDDEIASTTDTVAALIQSLIDPHDKSTLRKLRSIELINADVSIGNETDGVVVSAPDTTFIVRKESSEEINTSLSSVIRYRDHESAINGQFAYNKKRKRIEGVVNTDKLYVSELANILLNDSPLASLQLPISGKVGFAFNGEGKLDALKFAVDGGKGKIAHEKIDGTLAINRLKITGSATDGLTHLTVDNASIDFSGSAFTGKGTVINDEKGFGIVGEVAITNVETDRARQFWPLGLAPLSREWVTGNIHGGKIAKATALLNIQQGDLSKASLPKEAVDARIELRDAKIKYLPGHPEVRSVNALIKVDGLSLDAAVNDATAFTDSKLSAGRVYIADLNPDNPLIELSMHADAPAGDIVTLLGLPMLEHAKHLNLDAGKATGRATGDAKLSFYFFSKDESGNDTPLTYSITSKLSNVGTPGFLGRFDIEGATGDMSIDEKAIHFSGTSTVNGAAFSSSKVRYDFAPEGDVDTTIQATGAISDSILRRFGVRLPIVIRDTANVTVDAELSTHKAATAITRLSVKGEGVNIVGNALLTPDGKDLQRLSLAPVHYEKTKLGSLQYAASGDGYSLKLAGDALDASSMFEKKGEGFSFEQFPRMDIDIDVATLIAANGQEIGQVKASLLCSSGRCKKASINGILGEKRMAFNIAPEGRNRRLSMSTDNAGAVLKAFDITEGMEGGTLSLAGQFDDAASKGMLRGTLRIHDYTLKNTPVLAKILSLASLTGFFDTLSGNGIAFKKLEAPYSLRNDVITLKDARAYGPAMGMTADGTISFPQSSLLLEGTIVPSYTLNNVVGKVPVLGDLLMGGEGQGVFAARYAMKGNSDDPEVSVNPLSILTPGFLRKLFDVF